MLAVLYLLLLLGTASLLGKTNTETTSIDLFPVLSNVLTSVGLTPSSGITL